MTPFAITLVGPDGKSVTLPLKPGSWSGSGHRAAVEIDGKRFIVHVDAVQT